MGKTVQIRNLDSSVEERLRTRAEAEGLSLSAFLRRELGLLAERLELEDRWREDLHNGPGLDMDAIVQEIRELRGPLP